MKGRTGYGVRCCTELRAVTRASRGSGSVHEQGGAQRGAPGSKEEQKESRMASVDSSARGGMGIG